MAGFLAVTVAPGIAAFCGSRTRPVTVPVVCCAATGAQPRSTHNAAPANLVVIPMPPAGHESPALRTRQYRVLRRQVEWVRCVKMPQSLGTLRANPAIWSGYVLFQRGEQAFDVRPLGRLFREAGQQLARGRR